MKFKEWMIDEINKGLARQFSQQIPNVPKYVTNQILQNRIAPLWKNTMAANAPTMSSVKAHPKIQALAPTTSHYNTPEIDSKRPTYKNPKDIYKDPAVNPLMDKNWKLETVQIHPLSFTQQTIHSFLHHEFGTSPSLSNLRNHAQRMVAQTVLAAERGQGNNEPILMTREGDKFHMQEGWHRLYSYLIKFSAPPEERAKIDAGRTKDVDFSLWKPIKIKAYIGT